MEKQMARILRLPLRSWAFLLVLGVSIIGVSVVEAACTPGSACANGGTCTTSSTCLCAVDWLGPDCMTASRIPLSCYNGNQAVYPGFQKVQPQAAAGTWCFQYAFDNTAMHFAMYGQALGYVAFMLGAAGDGMNGGTTWVAEFQTTTTVKLHEDLGLPNFAVTRMSSQNTQNLLFGVAGLMNATGSHVQWSRMLASTVDTTVKTFAPANLTTFATFAIHTDPTLPSLYATTVHTYAGGFQLNLATGGTFAGPMVDYQGFAYTPTIIFLAVIVGVSVIFLPSFMRSRTSVGRLLMATKPFASLCHGVKSMETVNYFTLDAVRTLGELLLIEYFLVLAFVLWAAIVFALGAQAFSNLGFNPIYVWSHLCSFAFAFTILPCTRNSIIAPLFGTAYERFLKFHRWLGRITYLFLWIHFFTMVQLYGSVRIFENKMLPHGDSVVSGTVSLIAMSVLMAFAIVWMRRKHFEFFYYAHVVCYIVSVCTALIHSVHFRYYAVIPICLWIIDRIIRAYKSNIRGATVLSAKVHVAPDTSTITELEIDVPGMTYEAGQYVFINVPKCSKLDWHPISISSYDPKRPSTIRLHIIDVRIGEWSNSLAQYARRFENKLDPFLFVKIDGPLGHYQIMPQWYRQVALCGGGIGVTPMISTAMWLFHEIIEVRNPEFARIERVHLLFTSKQAHHIEQWFTADLQKLRAHPEKFTLHLYASGKQSQRVFEKTMEQRRIVRTMQMTRGNMTGKLGVPSPPPPPGPPPRGVPMTSSNSNKVSTATPTPITGSNSRSSTGQPITGSNSRSSTGQPGGQVELQMYGQGGMAAISEDAEGDWIEYENGRDNFTEFANQYAPQKYWYNVVTGQTSLTPPQQQTARNGRKSAAPPRQAIVAVTQTHDLSQELDIKFGRPDFFRLFSDMKNASPHEMGLANSACGVYMCGPVPFMDSVQAAADSLKLHTHRETFGF